MPDVIDLSQLPPPDAIEELDYEAILAEMTADYMSRLPEGAEPLLESDPAAKVLEAGAYRELLARNRKNAAVRAVLLAKSTGNDLEHITAFYGVRRQVVTPADPTATPPVDAVYEGDDRLRHRAQLATEGFSVAGPRQAYEFYALSADTDVLDARFSSPAPAEALVTLLSVSNDGGPSQALLDAVFAALSADDVRPAGDRLTVQPADITDYQVEAVLHVEGGPEPGVVLAASRAAIEAYAADNFRVGRSVPISGIYAALTVPNVLGVTLAAPAANVECTATQAARAASIIVTVA